MMILNRNDTFKKAEAKAKGHYFERGTILPPTLFELRRTERESWRGVSIMD